MAGGGGGGGGRSGEVCASQRRRKRERRGEGEEWSGVERERDGVFADQSCRFHAILEKDSRLALRCVVRIKILNKCESSFPV